MLSMDNNRTYHKFIVYRRPFDNGLKAVELCLLQGTLLQIRRKFTELAKGLGYSKTVADTTILGFYFANSEGETLETYPTGITPD